MMKEILCDFLKIIKAFEDKMMITYKINNNPYNHTGKLFERIGTIDDFSYHYHGGGCKVTYYGIICDYNFNPYTKTQVEFSEWYFLQFINSHPKYKDIGYTEDIVESELLKLIDEGILSWLIIEGRVYSVYVVN